MRVPFIDLKSQYESIKEEIDQAIFRVIDDADFINGKYAQKFEQEFAAANQSEHCIAVANGTDALYISLKVLGVGPGDEVITTACSWVSNAQAILDTGATPVFVDIDNYYLINSDLIEEKITSNTKAIIPVHLYGQMADVKSIRSICQKYGLYMIEDCAQAHFARLNNNLAGSTGEFATFSFYPVKNLGAYGDSGAILTNDKLYAEKCRKFANHGALTKHNHESVGMNSRIDGIQASILSAKLPYIHQWNKLRQEIAKAYFVRLNGLKGVQLPRVKEGANHVFHQFVVEVERRDELMEYLARKGITTEIHYPEPLPFLKCYKKYDFSKGSYELAEEKKKKIVSLPIYPEITNDQIDYVCNSIIEFYQQ